MTDEDARARNRFFLLSLSRISGTVLVVLGLIIYGTDLLREGGWPELGMALMVVGLIESLLLPRILARKWRTPPSP